MLFNGTDLWPLLLLIVGCGSVVTVVLSLLIATVPLPRRPHRQPVAARYHDDAAARHDSRVSV